MTQERISLPSGREVVMDFDTSEVAEAECQVHDLPTAGLHIVLFEGMRSPAGVMVCPDCVTRARQAAADALMAERGRKVLEAAKAWAEQGSRSKWTTPQSLALWDAVASLEEAEQRVMGVTP